MVPASQPKGASVNLSMCENSCRFSLSKTLILQNTQFLCSSQPQPSGKWLLCLKSKEKWYHYLSWNTLDSSDKEGNDQGPFQRGWLQIGLLGLNGRSTMTYCVAQGTLLTVTWQPGWEGSLGKNGYLYMYGWVHLQSTWNYHNTVNCLHSNTKLIKKKKERKGCGQWGKEEAFSAEQRASWGQKEWNSRVWGELWAILVLF